jgi:hypothetical protein
MTHITKELSDAILKSLYDTGHRFNSTWRQIILDVVEDFSAIGSMGSSLVAEDLRGFHLNDVGFADTAGQQPHAHVWNIHKPMTRELLATVELSDVNTPWADEDIVVGERWGKVGPLTGWFLERIRELNFTGTEDHREFRYRGRGASILHHGWWWNTCGVAGGNERLSGCLEEITWSVLIKYLSFIREMSNWTMPITPGPATPHRDCVNHWQRLMNGEVSGMGEGHVYECFNQEQGERLPVTWNQIARRDHVVPREESGEARQDKKKKMIHEIQSIIKQQVDEDKITEQKYKDLSELLMEFHKSIK